jgi:beta-lactamase superfamily II metal-dependent hydrolase
MPADKIDPGDLVVHVLNVGFGDTAVIEFPVDKTGRRSYGLVDCRKAEKTRGYLDKLVPAAADRRPLSFVCATHPHGDHISGIEAVLKDAVYSPLEFWESGFRHNSVTYRKILEVLLEKGIRMIRLSSGMEFYFGSVRVSVLSPSVALRNRYATYGVDMNNASVVLRLENYEEDVLLARSREYKDNISAEDIREAGKSVVILAGDAEFDSWAQITQEYPRVERTGEHDPLVKKMVNYLSCAVVKVAHHGSMHSAPLDVYEKMSPGVAVISTAQTEEQKTVKGQTLKRGLFPHPSSTIALEECGATILTTDGSYESEKRPNGQLKNAVMSRPGSIVIVVPRGGRPRWTKLNDKADEVPAPPTEV